MAILLIWLATMLTAWFQKRKQAATNGRRRLFSSSELPTITDIITLDAIFTLGAPHVKKHRKTITGHFS